MNKKYKLDKLSITWLWVLDTNYQRNMVFCPSYNLPKIKIKIKPRSTYPKTLNSKARLRNGKVLGTHFAQTEFGLLVSRDQCTPFTHDVNDMLHTWKTKSHKSIYECILFFVKNSNLCCDKKKKKKKNGLEKSDLCLLNKTKSFDFKKKYQICFWELEKNWFLVCIKKKNQICFLTKKKKICRELEKIRSVFLCKIK